MRHASATLSLLLGVLFASIVAAQTPLNPAVAPASNSASPEQVARWAGQLDSDLFATREEATQQLIAAGAVAVQPVTDTIIRGSPEAAMRGIHILRELALSGEANTEAAARAALQTIVDGKPGSIARRAASTIATLDALRQQRALADLERLGAKVSIAQTLIGVQPFQEMQSVEIGEAWQGEEKDLWRLKWLSQVDQIVFRRVKISEEVLAHVTSLKNLKVLEVKYVPIDDRAIEHLKELKGVLAIRLYGTAISKGGADKLQAALANAKIDLRQGGFMGVGGQAHPQGFAVTIVHPGSAADKADLRVKDVIVKYHDKPIADFEALTAEISKNRPGDMIRLEVLRDEQTVVKSLTLGEWDERANQP